MLTDEDIAQLKYKKSDMQLHIKRIYEAAKGAKQIVEIGVKAGNSTKVLLKVVQENSGRMFSIDIRPYFDAIPPDKNEGWTFQVISSRDWVCPWDHIDVLFIDGDDYIAHKDFKRFEPFVRLGGKIMMHDSLWWPISDFVDNLDREKYTVVKYDDCYGLSIITKKYY